MKRIGLFHDAALPQPPTHHPPCRRASAEDVSRALDGEAVLVSSLSPLVQADLEGQEEGVFVLVHTVEATGMVFTACVWKVGSGIRSALAFK